MGDTILFEAEDFFDMSLDIICITGFDGYFKRVNPSWIDTLGWSLEELQSRPIIDFVHPNDQKEVLRSQERLQSGQNQLRTVNRYRCKSGTYRWFESRSIAYPDRQLVYVVARDITEQKLVESRLLEAQQNQKELERQLIFADRMASVGTLAAGVAHEINNPLAYTSANLRLILSQIDRLAASFDPELLEELRDMTLDAQDGAHRIATIVGGLKTFARNDVEELHPVSLIPVIKQSITMTYNEIRHRARLVQDFRPLPPVAADESRLNQVFINLLLNAAQAIPDDDHQLHEIHVVTRTDHLGNAIVEVRDSGCGIPPSIANRIFDPFYTTKPVGQGTGLGLSICHNIITALGGTIDCDSHEHVGTTFRITLPPAQSSTLYDAHPTIPIDISSPLERKPATILVVDDEPAIGRALSRILLKDTVTIAHTVDQALQLLHSGKTFDLILSDLIMPHVSGMDFYDELTKDFPHLLSRVIFISGGAFTSKAQAFIERVPNRLLQKPFDIDEVLDCVQSSLSECH